MVWAIVDVDCKFRRPQRFLIMETGEWSVPDLFDEFDYIDTAIMRGGSYVLHVFKEAEK